MNLSVVLSEEKNSWVQAFEVKKVFELLAYGGNIQTILKHQELSMLDFVKFILQAKFQKCCSSVTTLGPT